MKGRQRENNKVCLKIFFYFFTPTGQVILFSTFSFPSFITLTVLMISCEIYKIIHQPANKSN